ncbi:thromboxane-A synthase-like isoform X2 [Macrobrachium nipponense]
MLRQILIKDFPAFANRARYFLAKKPYSDMIVDMRDHHWKFLRRLTAPVFSLSRLKMMMGLMQGIVDDFLAVVSEHADSGLDMDIFSISQRLTLDVIGRCALAMKLECLKNPEEPLLLLVRRFFRFAISPLVVMAMIFPGLAPWLRYFRGSTDSALVERAVMTNLRDVLARRRATPYEGCTDFLQLLIDASDDPGMLEDTTLEMTDQGFSPQEESQVISSSQEDNSQDDPESPSPSKLRKESITSRDDEQESTLPSAGESPSITRGKTDKPKSPRGKSRQNRSREDAKEGEEKIESQDEGNQKQHKLTDDEVVSNAYMFILAGYETTANAIAYTCYILAKHQEWQDKCFEEIKTVIGDKKQLSYEDISRLTILDRVYLEALRLYPPVPCFVTREAGMTTQIGTVTIPQGVSVTVPVWHIHHHPQFWHQPSHFDPDRFLPEKKKDHHPMAYLPFGAGPRNCLGMRFARLEIKLVIACMLKDYALQLSPLIKDPLPVEVRTVTLSPKEGVLLHIRRRTS